VSYFAAHNTYIEFRILSSVCAFAYTLVALYVFRRRNLHLASLLLVGFYLLFASLAIWQWGIHIAVAILMMSITITLAGILLGARYSLYTAGLASLVIMITQLLTTLHLHMPDTSWQKNVPSKFGEAFGYCVLFVGLAVVSWA